MYMDRTILKYNSNGMSRTIIHIRLNISQGNQLTELYNNVHTFIDKCNKLKQKLQGIFNQ